MFAADESEIAIYLWLQRFRKRTP